MNCLNRGQALLESVISLPALVALFSAMLIGGHSLLTDFLMDQWLYESTFCLVEEKPKQLCLENLKTQVTRIPFLEIQSLNLFRRSRQVHVQARLKLPYLKKPWNFKQSLPEELNHRDFKEKF